MVQLLREVGTSLSDSQASSSSSDTSRAIVVKIGSCSVTEVLEQSTSPGCAPLSQLSLLRVGGKDRT